LSTPLCDGSFMPLSMRLAKWIPTEIKIAVVSNTYRLLWLLPMQFLVLLSWNWLVPEHAAWYKTCSKRQETREGKDTFGRKVLSPPLQELWSGGGNAEF